ncbi:MAG: hypothetical protein AAFV95_17740 [Bacteroidota bacterium]
MKEVKAYISNIDPLLLQHVTGRVGKFIHLLAEKEFLSEEIFIRSICGEKYDQQHYDNLKHRALKILQALALVSVFKGSNEVKKKLDFCRKNFALGQKFLGKGVRDEGIRLIRQAHRVAVRYDFVHMASELSSILFHHHMTYEKKSSLANRYARQLEAFAQDYLIEKRTELSFYNTVSQLHKSTAPEILQRAITFIRSLDGRSLKYQTHLSILNIIHGFAIGDYEGIIKHGLHAIQYFDGRQGMYDSHHQFFRSKLGIAYIATGNYSLAHQSFADAQEFTHPNSKNDYILRLYRTINAIHAGDYGTAYQLYRKNRKCRFPEIKLQFAIIEAYLCFLAHQGYLKIDGRFRIGKFLNETFESQSDKQGNNLAVLIAELLVYLCRDHGKFIDRVERIHSYSYRHLRGRATSRAKRFVKLLCLIPRVKFNAALLAKVGAKEINYLNQNPIWMGDSLAIEVIPFEKLLCMVVKQLQKKVA